MCPCLLLISLRSRRQEINGRKKKRAQGDTRGERERLHGRPPKIVSRPLSNYLAVLRDLSNLLTENWYHFAHWNAHLREILQHVGRFRWCIASKIESRTKTKRGESLYFLSFMQKKICVSPSRAFFLAPIYFLAPATQANFWSHEHELFLFKQ